MNGFVFPLSTSYVSGVLTPAGASRLRLAGVLQAFRLGQLPAPVARRPRHVARRQRARRDFREPASARVLDLPRNAAGCLRADIDIDGDGLEVFCDDGNRRRHYRVDTCIDGSGVELHDGDNGVADCSQAMKHGRPRFVDGISAQVVLAAKPAAFTP